MEIEDFRQFAKASVDYIADYFETIREKQVLSSVEPGYLAALLPDKTPTKGDTWHEVLQDVDQILVPGLTHWHSPHFHAYFPTANSFPGIVGDLFLSGLGVLHKDWQTSPACVELEVRVMDWLCRAIGLPEEFLNESDGPGGGVIQNAASESTLVGLLCGKMRTVNATLKRHPHTSPHMTPEEIRGKLVAYTSKESNSSVEKSSLLASVPMRLLKTDKENRLRADALEKAIQKDKAQGLIPCCVVASLGTTGTCSFDDLEELGRICQRENIWLHVDAAYAGAALVCPEYRHLIKGIEYVDSFNFNPHKWLLTNADCSAMWFRNTKYAEDALKVKSAIPEEPDVFEPDIPNWQIPSCRRFRSLKLWFVMRIYGIEGLQKHIRHQISLAKYLEELVRADERFELLVSSLGVVCFRLIGEDSLTQQLLDRIAERKNLFIMPYYFQGKLVIRFVICSLFTEREDILYAWNEIMYLLQEIFNEKRNTLNQIKQCDSFKEKLALSTELSDKISAATFL